MNNRTVTLTDRGRVRAVLVRLERRWDALSPEQQREARDLVDRLAATYRTRPTAQPVREMSSRAGAWLRVGLLLSTRYLRF